MTVDLRDLTVYDAERWLVGACIDHEVALLVALDSLPLHPFRSHRAQELERLFYTVAGWFDIGKFDGMKNRDRLSLLFQECNLAEEEAWCDALTKRMGLEADALAATKRWRDEYPLEFWSEPDLRPAFPPPALRPIPRAKAKPKK